MPRSAVRVGAAPKKTKGPALPRRSGGLPPPIAPARSQLNAQRHQGDKLPDVGVGSPSAPKKTQEAAVPRRSDVSPSTTTAVRSRLNELRHQRDKPTVARVGVTSPSTEGSELLKRKIQRLRDQCPKFLRGESRELWSKNLDKLLAYADQQPAGSEGFLRIKTSVDLFESLHNNVSDFAALGKGASENDITRSLAQIKQSQSALDKSLFSLPQKIARGFATAAMALIGAAIGAFVGAVAGAAYGFINSFPGANAHTATFVGGLGALLGAGMGAAIGGRFAWNAFSNKSRSTGEVDLSTMIPQEMINTIKKDIQGGSVAKSADEPGSDEPVRRPR